MILALCGITAGVLAGLFFPGVIPKAYSMYVGIGLLSSFDSIVGALNAKLKKTYDSRVFVSGFIINSLLAVGLIYFGKLLGLDFSVAALVVFGMRLFGNFASIRRLLLYKDKKE